MSAERSRTAETRHQLFEAAIRLFRERGYDATSADDIAAAAGVSRATFFNHFGSKAAVLRFFGEDLEERISALLARRAAGTPALPELRRVLLAMAAEAEAHRESLKIVLVHSVQDHTYLSKPTAARVRILQQVTALVAEAQKAGEARADVAAATLAGQLLGLYNQAVLGILFHQQTAAAAIGRVWQFAEGGLTGSAPGRRTSAAKRRRT